MSTAKFIIERAFGLEYAGRIVFADGRLVHWAYDAEREELHVTGPADPKQIADLVGRGLLKLAARADIL